MARKKPKAELLVTYFVPTYDTPEQEAAAVARANEAMLQIAGLLGRQAARDWIEQETQAFKTQREK